DWEVNRIQSITLEDGSPLIDDQIYTLATIDFLLGGGDDLGWILGQLPLERQDPPAQLLRAAVIDFMREVAQRGPLNSTERPLVNPADPRIRFEKKFRRGGIKSRVR